MRYYGLNHFTVDPDNETILTDNQLWISIFNPSIPKIFKVFAELALNHYIEKHQEIIFDKSDSLVCVLQTYLTKPNKRYTSIYGR